MSHSPTQNQTAGRPGRRLLGGFAAAVLVAGFGAACSGGDDSEATLPSTAGSDTGTVTELVTAPASDARCLPPRAADAARQSIAFEGVVTEIAAGTVTLRPLHFYTGTETSRVRIAQPDPGMSEGPARFEVGGDYIVGANDGQVSICGLTGVADDDLRALYAGAFGE